MTFQNDVLILISNTVRGNLKANNGADEQVLSGSSAAIGRIEQ
jgi:hypothetical protein